jgi:hypothetical protein
MGLEIESERELFITRERERERKDPKFPFLISFLCLILFASSSFPLHLSSSPDTAHPSFCVCIRHAFIHHQPPRKSQRRKKQGQKRNNAKA